MLHKIPLLSGPSLFGLLLFSALARAQVMSPAAVATDTATMFGNGERPELSYADEERPLNIVRGELAYEFAYDDNPLGTIKGSAADVEQVMAASAFFQHQGEHLRATAGYEPYYEHFWTYSQYNQFSQLASGDIRLIPNASWSVRARDSYLRQRGPFEPLLSSSLPPGPGAPGGLNPTVFTPLGEVEANSARVDGIYKPSAHSFVDLFGGYDRRSLSQLAVAATLYNTRGPYGGAQFGLRPGEHSVVGILGLFQRLDFPGASGIPTRIEIASLLPTWGSAPRPGWQLQAYAGPQMWLRPPVEGENASQSLTWAGGGNVSRQGERTAFLLSADRMLADGGGLLPVVESTDARAAIRHRIVGHWDGSFGAEFTRNSVVGPSYGMGSFQEASATAELTRPLRGNLVWHIAYGFFHQLSSDGAPAVAEFRRNRIASGLSWQFGAHALGR